jgi:hypothetical protein
MTTQTQHQPQEQEQELQVSEKNSWVIAKPILEKDYLEGRATDD